MKIVVVGGTGLIGRKLVARLESQGYDALSASPGSGVNSVTGEGLDAALAQADVVVDVANSPSFEDASVLAFFEDSTRNLIAAARTAGVAHFIALSVVGTDRTQGSGYFRAKLAQERLIAGSGLPYTILRATQFFEFMQGIAASSMQDGVAVLSPAAMQPIAADDVVSALADVISARPAQGIQEVAGPERAPLADFVRKDLAAAGDRRETLVDAAATYFGAPIDDASLVPASGARIMERTQADWLAQIRREG